MPRDRRFPASRPPLLSRRPWVALLLLAACTGGSCAGCEGCGLAPIPDGFPPAERMPDAASLRLTEAGLDFLGARSDALLAAAGVGDAMSDGIDFPVPRTSGSASGFDFTLCGGRDCVAHLDVEDVALAAVPPATLGVTLGSRLESRSAAGARRAFPLRVVGACIDLGFTRICLVDTTCDVDVDTSAGARPGLTVETGLAFGVSGLPPRDGLVDVAALPAAIPPDGGFEDADVSFGGCDGVDGFFLELLAGDLEAQLVEGIESSLPGVLGAAVDDAFCARAVDGVCPGDTAPDDAGVCRVDGPGAPCLPALLGTEGQGDLGAATVGSAGPGAAPYTPGQLLLALGGETVAADGALTFGLAGGLRTTPDAAFGPGLAHDPCVPLTDPPALGAPPRPGALAAAVIPGTDVEPHVAFALSEAYLDHALWALWDGGAFCLAAGTEADPTLTTGLLSLLVESLGALVFPDAEAPVRFALRPGAPPDATIATAEGAPLLSLAFPSLAIDLYVWSAGRYLRVLTYTADLTFALDLTAEGGALVPTLAGVSSARGAVTNSPLLREDPAALTLLFDTAATMLAEGLFSGLGPVPLPAVGPFALAVPEGGGPLGVAEGDARFLAVYGLLEDPTPVGAGGVAHVDTDVAVDDLALDPAGLALDGLGDGPHPAVTATVRPLDPLDLGGPFETSVRLDGGPWTPWSTAPRLTLSDAGLRLQGRHVLEARARVVGQRGTADPTPARVEVLVDVRPPAVEASATATGVDVQARDLVSPASALRARFRREGAGGGDAGWSAWGRVAPIPATRLPAGGGPVVVEVRDEVGNVGRASVALSSDVARPTAGGCRVGTRGAGDGPGLPWLAALGLLALGRRRRRRSSRSVPTVVLAVALAAGLAGCGSSRREVPPCDDACAPAAGDADTGTVCCVAEDVCVDYSAEALCPAGSRCAADAVATDASCAPTCDRCVPSPGLEPGLLAFDLDAVGDGDGGLVLAGYAPGVPGLAPRGDLVVGRWPAGADAPVWEVVDGVPAEPPVGDPGGWRGGVAAPGDDVGRWASLARTPDDGWAVAYHDATGGALRLATQVPGGPWRVAVLDGPGVDDSVREAGLDAALLVFPGGAALAHRRVVRDPERPGRFASELVVARVAEGEDLPPLAGPWTPEVVARAPAPCRPAWCGDGERCFADGRCAAPTDDCEPGCGAGAVCRDALCEAVLPDRFVEALPPHVGLFAALAPLPDGRLAVAWHDGLRGDVLLATTDGDGAWSSPLVVDGASRGVAGAGPAGRALAMVAVPSGALHVVYVDSGREALRHAVVVDGAVVARETVDDGATDPRTGERFPDGRHRVGDDASLLVTPGGELRVLYQDATAATLRLARRPVDASGPFARLVADDRDATGFFPVQAMSQGEVRAACFFRAPADEPPRSGVRAIR